MSTGPKFENRGGHREGSGRKSVYAISDVEAKKMLKEARARAKNEGGKSLNSILLDIAYAKIEGPDGGKVKVDVRDRLAAIKVYKEFTMGRHTENRTTIEDKRPIIGLPEMKPDPARVAYPKEGNA